jgi:chromosome segregation ATPase
MRITLHTLTLKHFKGIKKFELRLDGQNAAVYGDNATGKTTLYDAFLWLLFDKDSLNRANFGIKTLDEDGQAINGLEHIVEAVLDVDGKPLTLKKVYYEKWTKTRGSSEKVFSGHTTDYFIDDVPKSQKEYKEKIAELGEENIFRLLTDPRFFNEQLHWQDRRKMLLEVCGDISDQDVISSDKRLAKLSGILGNRSIDDHKKVIAAKRRKINEQLEKIPVRIDEVQNSMPDIEGLDFGHIHDQIEETRALQDIHRKTISRIESGGEIAEKEKQITLIDTELMRLRTENDKKKREALSSLFDEQDKLHSDQKKLKNDLVYKQLEADKAKRQIELGEKSVSALREEWYKVNDEAFEFGQDTVCPTCGQAIPEDQLQEARDKALKDFNLKKSKKLESINEEGKQAAADVADKKLTYNKLTEEVATIEKELYEINSQITDIDRKITDVRSVFEDIETTNEYKAKASEKEQLMKEIRELKAGTRAQIEKEREFMNLLESEITKLQTKLAKKEQHEKALARIAELEAEEKQLAKELEEFDEQLYLTEEFVKTKVRLLEDKINSKFRMAKFKLFDIQVNGGINECCETVYDGVPYSDLNNAARINIGLDIINTLSEHYSFSAPIFVDNRESVTRLTDVDTQVISLVVSEQDKKLRVELEESRTMKEAI